MRATSLLPLSYLMLPSINKVLTYLLLTYNMYFIHQMLMHKVVFNPLILFLSLYHTCTTHNSFLLTWPFYFSHVEAKNSVSPQKLKCPLENCWLGQNVPQKWNPRSDTDLSSSLIVHFGKVGFWEGVFKIIDRKKVFPPHESCSAE